MTVVKPIPFNAEEPQPLLREIPKGDAYPVEALGPLRAVVEAVHDKTQAPIAIAAQSALSVASLAVQGFADVETLAGYSPCSLYCLTIAQSGERKSACDKFLMQSVREFEADRDAGYRIDYVAHETALKLWEHRRSRMLKDAAGNGDRAIQAKVDLDALPPPPEPPLVPILTASEPTFPGLVKLFRVGRPALGLFTDEAGAFVGGHSMNSDNKLATVAGLSSLWKGNNNVYFHKSHRYRRSTGCSLEYARGCREHC